MTRGKRTNKTVAKRTPNIAAQMTRQTAGSMGVATNPAKERKTIRTRQFLVPVWEKRTSSQILSQTQSPAPLGGQYCSDHITIKADSLGQNAREFIQNSDRYRITKAELFVLTTVDAKTNTTRGTAPITHYAYCDADTSVNQSTGVTPWLDVVSRENVSKVTLRSNNPTMRIAQWNPRPILDPESGNSPANLIPSPNSWVDSLYLSQEHSGVRTFATCPSNSDQQDNYQFYLYYEIRVTVQTQAAL